MHRSIGLAGPGGSALPPPALTSARSPKRYVAEARRDQAMLLCTWGHRFCEGGTVVSALTRMGFYNSVGESSTVTR